jgi:internalin A
MARDKTYSEADKRIEEAKRSKKTQLDLSDLKLKELPETVRELQQLQVLNLSRNDISVVPDWLSEFAGLQRLDVSHNKLTALPESVGKLKQLWLLDVSNNKLVVLPESLGELTQLERLEVSENELTALPESLGQLVQLGTMELAGNKLTDIPASFTQLRYLRKLNLDNTPLNLELAAAYKQGLNAVQTYLRAKAASHIILNEAKLILVGEGEVGKSCLLNALRDDPFVEGLPSTHGIEIKPVKVFDTYSKKELTLNGWDFGGQRVYRPTHQLFFSAPAVYLVVWKPREGPQQGFIKEWIQLIKRREPTAKIIVVATHGGPGQRQPDIDRQELWDIFSRETVIDFFHVDSKPDAQDERRGIQELKRAIARVAATLPEVGRSVPKRWQEVRDLLSKTKSAYLPLQDVTELCHLHEIDDNETRLFLNIEHRLGHLIHYQHDPTLRDIVVLKPDWLATAISFVLDDEVTRKAHGLVRLSRLSQLWNDPIRADDTRYPSNLHPIFLRLMQRFDLSYLVADPAARTDSDPLSLIAQLVPDVRPEKDLENSWSLTVSAGDLQQTQICRIVDAQNAQSASAEGLFYQLIVRLHRYSLGRVNYNESAHWQRGLVLDDDYNGRALLEHVGNDVRITVRAPYPERFLAMLTGEVKYLVESFWEGLRCDIMVPCIEPCGRNAPGTGLFEVDKLIESKKNERNDYPCVVCNKWQNIDQLLRNAPAAQPNATTLIFAEFADVKSELAKARQQISYLGEKTMGRFDRLDERTRRTLSRVDNAYTNLIQVLTDEAKEGPRLFTLVPKDRSRFTPREFGKLKLPLPRWIKESFILTLWCEHSRLPLPALNGNHSRKGVYEIELDREWFKKAAPFLRLLMGTLSLVLPVAASSIKLAMDENSYKEIEEQLEFGKSVLDATIGATTKIGEFYGAADKVDLKQGEPVRAHGATLREFQTWLKGRDISFGGLVRVMNKRQEFLWVHEQFTREY